MEYIEFGKIVNTHGLKGEIKVYSYTDNEDKILSLKKIYIDEVKYLIEAIRYQKNMFVIKLKGIDNIYQTENIINKYILREIDKSDLDEENGFFVKDLIGIDVYNIQDEKIGILKEVYNNGASDIYVITLEDNKEVLLPAIKQTVKEIDINNKKMIVDIMEGLL